MNLHNPQSIDPVCLKKLDTLMASHQLTYRNITYHFCSAHCQERFSEAPVFFSAPRRIDEQHPIAAQALGVVVRDATSRLE